MFDDSQTAQGNDSDNTNGAPSMGLGVNPTSQTLSGVNNLAASGPEPAPQVVLPAAHDNTSHSASAVASNNDDLQSIKQHALEQLSPLVHKLEQTPEEKYKTLMMMIQASDNQDLLGEAYQAAQAITDEKVKAEALLNIVNEINYFTQKSQ